MNNTNNNRPQDMKVYAIVSSEALKKMNGNRGKLGAMVGHAFVHALWDADARHSDRAQAYKNSGLAKKVVLLCNDEALMRQLAEDYRPICGTTVVEDAGLTVFDGKTFAAVGMGPLTADECDERLARLKVLI
jgi:peptidyl-tRNA hydrolase